MLATIKSLPNTIGQLIHEYEQENLHGKAKAVLDSCYENFPCEGSASPYTLRLERLTKKCQQVRNQKVRFHIFKAEGEAFTLSSGDICVFTTLMDRLTDDELMFVIGHEIGHFINEDALWGNRAALTAEATAYIATFAISSLPWGKAASVAVKTSLLRKFLRIAGKHLVNKFATNLITGVSRICYSRSQEYRADQYGIRFLHSQGLNVDAAASSLKKLRDNACQGRIAKLASDHPDINKRIAELNRLAKIFVS